jgi:hypothetical protein
MSTQQPHFIIIENLQNIRVISFLSAHGIISLHLGQTSDLIPHFEDCINLLFPQHLFYHVLQIFVLTPYNHLHYY